MPSSDSSFEALTPHDIPTCLGRIRVRVGGAGPAMMFWSSLLMSGRMWAAQAQHFGQRYRVLLVDPPGHGDSEPLTRLFSFDECARCVVQILDALHIDRSHFVGNSWGGMIGGTFAARHPERAGLCVLMNCTAARAGLRHRIEYPLLARVLRLSGGVKGPLTVAAIRAFTGPTSRRQRPQVVQTIREALGRVNAESVHWAIRSVVPRRPDQRALLRSIHTPVLVVAGAEDAVFPVAETRAMADAISGAEFRVLPGVAHLAGLEVPSEVNAMIEAKLRALEGTP